MVERRIGNIAATDDTVRHTDGSAVSGYGGQDDGTRPNASAIANVNVAEHFGASSDNHTVSHRRVPLARFFTLINQDIVTHDRGLTNHDAHAVVDDETTPQLRAGMNLDTRQTAAEVADEPRQQR